mmetsp:Transcript_10039/g.21717  ORF Transcript_10039/g.21717 Transcript_10039/m.21717 type:complete len:144 (+) Transcript_10039:1344-1775(+)
MRWRSKGVLYETSIAGTKSSSAAAPNLPTFQKEHVDEHCEALRKDSFGSLSTLDIVEDLGFTRKGARRRVATKEFTIGNRCPESRKSVVEEQKLRCGVAKVADEGRKEIEPRKALVERKGEIEKKQAGHHMSETNNRVAHFDR